MPTQRFKGEYGQSECGNFKVVGTVAVPHPYCLTPKHILVAHDDYCGILREDAIRGAESKGAHCGVRGCELLYSEHEQSLVVECKTEVKDRNGRCDPELHAYLLAIKDEAIKNGYAGFAFMQKKEG